MSCKLKFPDRTEGSAYTPIEVVFNDEDGYAINLAGVDHVQVQAKILGEHAFVIDSEMTIYDATNGIARYQMTAEEASNVGTLEFKFWIWHTSDEDDAEAFPYGESVYMTIKEF